VLTPDAQGDPEAAPVQQIWAAPSLNDIFYRFTDDPATGIQQVNQVITYGRPGTPMPAWGVAGGGPKNTQAVTDLVEYLRSIQISPDKARAQAAKKIADFKKFAAGQEAQARDDLAKAEEGLANAKTQAQRDKYTGQIEAARIGITQSQEFAEQVAGMSQGELLFNTQCARCHTNGWSTLEPSNGFSPMPAPTGSGAYGPSLRDGATLDQFPGDVGKQKQYDWVAIGVEANKGYGVRGISSGRMPHFGEILTKAQIEAIIEFERSL
jgi:mono/diheme cytochrome c family protein